MDSTSHDTARKIRQMFMSRMDGTVAQNMRDKGMEYRVNWGVTMMHLIDLAKEFTPDLHVALELWKDDVRESKLMALLLMPVKEFTPDIAAVWTESLRTQEIAEMAAMILFQHLDYAPQLAYRLISESDTLRQILGYSILSRLIARGEMPDARGLEELADQIKTAMGDGSLAVRHAAYNCFRKLDGCDILADSPFWHALCHDMEQKH